LSHNRINQRKREHSLARAKGENAVKKNIFMGIEINYMCNASITTSKLNTLHILSFLSIPKRTLGKVSTFGE